VIAVTSSDEPLGPGEHKMTKEELDKRFPGLAEDALMEEAIASAGLASDEDARRTAGGVAPELEEAGDMSTSDGLGGEERALDPLTQDDVERIGGIASAIECTVGQDTDGRTVRYLRKLALRIGATLGAVLVMAVLFAGCGGGSDTATSTGSDSPDQVVGRAIAGKPGLCDHIEMAVFLEGRGSAEGVFLKEWEEDGYQEQADGKEVFAELLNTR
jgi:hypothetical protein